MWKYKDSGILLLSVAGILFVGSLLTILWASNKGFDFSDEGYYIAGYSNLLEYNIGITAFHFLVLQTIAKFGSGLIYFRIVRLLATIASCFFLAYSLNACNAKYKLFDSLNSRRNIAMLTLIGFAGCLPGYGLGPQTLSYNHLTFVFATLFVGLLFLILAFAENNKKVALFSLLSGICFGLEFFVKIPVSVFMGFLFIIIVIILFKLHKFRTAYFSVLFLVGVTLSFVMVCFPNSPISIITEYLQLITTISKYAAHDISDVLANYQVGLELLWNEQLSPFVNVTGIILLAFACMVQKKIRWIRIAGAAIAFGCLARIVVMLHEGKYFTSGVSMYTNASLLYVLMMSLLLIVLAFAQAEKIVNRSYLFSLERVFIFACLFTLPLLCSFGTNNYLQIQILFFLNSWFLLTYLIYASIPNQKSTLAFWATCAFFILFYKAGSDLYSGLVVEPYRVKGPLWEQTEPLFLKATNETIYVNKDLSNTVAELSKSTSIKNAECLFTSSDLIGLGYVLDKKLIAFGWNDCVSLTKEYICSNFNNSDWAKTKSTLFVMNGSLNSCHVFDCFSDSVDYAKVLELPWTNNSSDTLFVYGRTK